MSKEFKSGFISIIGSPNVGKSTLMNYMVGQKVSIVSAKAQTTRNRIMGVVTRSNYQIVCLDTPGVIMPKNRLGEYMLKVAYESLNEVEAILFVVDANRGIGKQDEVIMEKLFQAKAPVIAVINKIDTVDEEKVEEIKDILSAKDKFTAICPISAQLGNGITELEEKIVSYLEAGPKYFPDDMVTDMPERIVCAEMIREKTLLLLREEVPHGVGVNIDKIEVREGGGLCDVWATIYCERAGHKGIIIGKNGTMLKRIGSEARKDIEWMLGMRVNLQLWVKIKDDWRNSASTMKELGYE